MSKKKQKLNEQKRERCKDCPNLFEYKDKEYRRKSFCIAFQNIYLHQNTIGECPFKEDE